MVKIMLIQYTIGCITLTLLILFAFCYQTTRNTMRIDNRFALAAFLLGVEGKSATKFEKEIETIDDFLNTFEDIISSYYTIPESSSGTFMHYTYDKYNTTPIAPLAEITFHEGYYGSSTYSSVLQKSFDILEDDPLGPFVQSNKLINGSVPCEPKWDVDGSRYIPCGASAIGEFFDHLLSVRLSFYLYSLVRMDNGALQPRRWSAFFLFELTGHSTAMDMSVSLNTMDKHTPERLPVIISSLMLPLVALSFLVRIYASFDVSGHLTAPKRKRGHCSGSAHHALEHPVVGEGGWRWLGFISDVLVLSLSLTSLATQFMPQTSASMEQAVTILLGFATLVNCVRPIAILKLFPSLYVAIDGFVTAAQQLSMYIVAIFPILLGYSICGNVVFGGYGGYFRTLPLSFVTLLCATFGDNLIDTFLEMDQSVYIVQLVFNRLFIGTFLLFAICIVLNVAHSIIQDSYLYAVQKHSSRHREEKEHRNAMSLGAEELEEILARLREVTPLSPSS